MGVKLYKSAWNTFIFFYVVLLAIVGILDIVNDILTLSYFGMQVGLVTLGVVVFAIVGISRPDLPAGRSVLLAFTVGILTIIPAVLMGLGRIPGFWGQYFSIAFGMAGGSFLTFLFLELTKKVPKESQTDLENDDVD